MTAAGAPLAAGPRTSVWVSASAGTGKTTVLTERLLRLMLDGTDPSRVLCLTFTRAGAAEMANRLADTLERWAILPSGRLAEEIGRLSGGFADPAMLSRARQLFARVLDTPGGVKIMTIHAFSQSLLRRFPLEAGVPPEFAVIEERGAGEALAEAGQRIIMAARDGRAPELARALAAVAAYMPEERFGVLMAAIAAERGRLGRALAPGPALLKQRLCAALSVAGGADQQSLAAAFCAEDAADEAGLRAAAAALALGSPTDRERGRVIAEWCAEPERRLANLAAYEKEFLTDDGDVRARLITKGAAKKAGCDAGAILAAEALRLKAFREGRLALTLVEASSALAVLGGALVAAYEEAKSLAGLLDFDDLVVKARDLLRRPGLAPWVLFKLDGGLDHILIDEAQDTNPEQWEIVAALAEEFFAGEGASDRVRTIFAVGDPKQSIFSFQRADPHAFLRMRRHFEARVDAARQEWLVLPLETSFRSTEPVLRAVDAVFGTGTARDGVALDSAEIRHLLARSGEAGLVELWPPVMPEPEEPAEAAALPIARRRVAEPYARLAAAIAATIRSWLENGELLPARGRQVRPGDIMVLVRRRDEFVGELLHALKQHGVPVAGADRLIMTEQLAVKDLVALGRFLLLPEDDLTLATVLKGPLFGIDEKALFDLCWERGEVSLWRRLAAAAGRDPKLGQMAEQLSGWLARADFVPPFELYAEILGADDGRRAFLGRLGPEAADPIEEFLGLALAYEREHAPSLQGFLRWLAAGDTEVKRDLAARRRDEVRILTVHGAKGLEAPIVFLPDTMALPTHPETLLWTADEELPLWCPRADLAAPAYTAEREAVRRRQLEEYRRLLYVGLTRAQDRLYICGWQGRNGPRDGSWHALCRAGLAPIAERFEFDTTPLVGSDGWTGEGLRLASPQVAAVPAEPAAVMPAAGPALPDWAASAPPPEPDPPRPLVPSRPGEAEPATVSPLRVAGRDRFKRGLVIHRLLQSLPELPQAEREAAARRFLAAPIHGLDAREQDEIRRETLAVLADPEFAPLFGPGSLAEVPIVGLVDGRALAGQIDRLVVTSERVLIVDYKTLREPPATEDAVPALYLRQLASYRAALSRIYAGHEIRCALLWTQTPLLMTISPERLAFAPP